MNNPVAFDLFGFEVMWYGILIGFGIVLAFILAYKNAKKKGLNFDVLIDIFLVSFPCAIIGARAYYVIFEWSNYKDDLLSIFNIHLFSTKEFILSPTLISENPEERLNPESKESI